MQYRVCTSVGWQSCMFQGWEHFQFDCGISATGKQYSQSFMLHFINVDCSVVGALTPYS